MRKAGELLIEIWVTVARQGQSYHSRNLKLQIVGKIWNTKKAIKP